MKKILLYIILFLVFNFSCLKSYSQKHILGFSYEPSIVTRVFSDIMYTSNPPEYHSYFGRIGNTFGIDYIYLFNNKSYGIKTGLYIIDNGFKVKVEQDEPFYQDRIDNFQARYISCPIEYYRFYNKLYLNIGANFNYSINTFKSIGNGEPELYESNKNIAFGLKTEIGLIFTYRKILDFKFGIFDRVFWNMIGNMNYGFILGINYRVH